MFTGGRMSSNVMMLSCFISRSSFTSRMVRLASTAWLKAWLIFYTAKLTRSSVSGNLLSLTWHTVPYAPEPSVRTTA